jgi:hypothetical protein
MRRNLAVFVLLAASGMALATPRSAEAGIPVIYGSGDRIDKVADLPPGHPALAEMGHDTAVGYMYWHLHVYWCPIWTSSGEFVVYQGDRYVPLGNDLDEIAGVTGLPKAKLGRPFLSLVPLGWLIAGGFVLVGTVSGMVQSRNSPAARLRRLLKEPTYQEALADAQNEPDMTKAYERAVSYVMGRGVPEAKARENVGLIFHSLAVAAEAEPSEASP